MTADVVGYLVLVVALLVVGGAELAVIGLAVRDVLEQRDAERERDGGES